MYFYNLIAAILTANYAALDIIAFLYKHELIGKQLRIKSGTKDNAENSFNMDSASFTSRGDKDSFNENQKPLLWKLYQLSCQQG